MRGLVAGAIVGTFCGIAGAELVECAPLPPSDNGVTVVEAKKATDYQDKLAECRRRAREAGSLAVYAACEEAGGL